MSQNILHANLKSRLLTSSKGCLERKCGEEGLSSSESESSETSLRFGDVK